jgi:hypothetical protein
MSQLTPAQARVVDPVLTSIAQGYKQLDLVGGMLFPTVPVMMRAGNIITFGKEDFMLYGMQRAPGENTRRVQVGYAGAPFALVDYGLEGALPVEIEQEAGEGASGFSIDAAAMTVNKVQAMMALRLEKAQADLARTAGNYAGSNKVTLTSTARWSDYTGVSKPLKDVENAKEAIRAATGKRPNVMVMGAAVLAALRQHPDIVDRMKYTGRDVATVEILASLFGVAKVVVGESIYSNDAGTTFTDVWGKDVVLAYAELGALASMGTPSYGYTYNLNGYPLVEVPYWDRSAKSQIFPVTRAEAPVIAAATAGYLIVTAVA